MDFVDWRKAPEKLRQQAEQEQQQTTRFRGRRLSDYVEEIIHEAQQRGEFDNLAGAGKPLNIENYAAAGDNAMAYHLLKNNNLVPVELELAKEIDAELVRIDARIARLIHQNKRLRSRRLPPFEREKRAFNVAVEKMVIEYEEALRRLNSKILSFNLSVPTQMHRKLLKVDELVTQFRSACPRFLL